VIYIDNQSLKHIKGQRKLNKRDEKWMEFIKPFPYVIKYKKGKENVVAYALSRRYVVLASLDAKLIGFEYVKEFYKHDSNFAQIFVACKKEAFKSFHRADSYLFRENKLFIPQSSMRELLVRKAHEGGLMRYFRVKRTLDVSHEHFYWPKMKHEVEKNCDKCLTYIREQNQKFYRMDCIHLYLYLMNLG